MIRLLVDADRAATLALLNQDAARNLYMLGNLEKLGFHHELSQFWGDFADNGGAQPLLRGVINRYMRGWSIYGQSEVNWSGLARILDQYPEKPDRLQDNPGAIESFLPFLKRYHAEKVVAEELMELARDDFRPLAAAPGITVRRATMADYDRLVTFYADADDMARTPPAVARPIQDTRLWFAEEEGAVLAAALTNAETKEMAMIGGVYTQPHARGRGLSQAVCSALCADLLHSGLRPVLYWGKPAAGAVYRKLGFHAIGQWRAVWLAES